MRFVRHPDLLLAWTSAGLLIRNLATRVGLEDAADLVEMLDVFDRPMSAEAAARRLGSSRRESIDAVRALTRLGLLIPQSQARRTRSRVEAWKGNAASALYHSACRDLPYLRRPGEIDAFFRTQVLNRPRPPLFRRYPGVPRVALPSTERRGDVTALNRILQGRRTVRRFREMPVSLSDLGAILHTTFGLSGAIPTQAFGLLGLKTSPSAGALHPTEAYLVAWNVRGLPRGLYHYDVIAGDLRRLRSGNFREVAIELASGQRWVGQAAFLCILTARFDRVLWKYGQEDSYRTLFLDAGHVAQTFCIVATALGLGPFTTAAIQDTKIEKLLRIDGIEEFPVYLCGAGVPTGMRRRGKRAAAPQRVRLR